MHPRELRIEDFTYTLPPERIAQHPLDERDASKLLVYERACLQDRNFSDMPQQLPTGALLVLNDTKVVKARLAFKRSSGASIECFILQPGDGRPMEQALGDRSTSTWWAMVGNAKRWKAGEVLRSVQLDGLVVERLESTGPDHLLRFSWHGGASFAEVLQGAGRIPLPPYMLREVEAADEERYNAVFARGSGSVAAPTASLHFTQGVLELLRHRGVRETRVTLHVGAGTFLPVRSSRMADHAMHREQVSIPRSAVEELRSALVDRRHIVPVGTTALRTIESLCWFGDDLLRGETSGAMHIDQWRPYDRPEGDTLASLDAVLHWMEATGNALVSGDTSLLIAPGYRFRLATGLITNFHQPGSTLLLLVAAFLGERWRQVYSHALSNEYRFLSYGDASLLWRDQ